MKFSLIAAAFAALLSTPAAALTWTVQNATFTTAYGTSTLAPGASVSGTFDFDAATDTYSNINLVVTGVSGSTPTGQTYSGSYTQLYFGYSGLFKAGRSASAIGSANLVLSFATPLTDAGGTVALSSFFVARCTFDASCGNSTLAANSSGVGSVTSAPPTSSVPLPAAAPLLLAGLGGLGLLRRRRRAA